MWRRRVVLLFLALLLLGVIAARLTPSNDPLPGVTVRIVGGTNFEGATKLVIDVPKILRNRPRVPPGHKAWYNLELQVLCTLADGTVTNFLINDRLDVPSRDQVAYLRLPGGVREARILKADGLLGSFQDVNLLVDFPSIRTPFRYGVSTNVFRTGAAARTNEVR